MPIPPNPLTTVAACNDLRLRTSRLEIVAATLELIETEAEDLARLGEMLNTKIPNWPPPGNDASSLQWSVERLRANPDHRGFHVWYVIFIESGKRTLVGLVAFKGPPDPQGVIEAGYSILENYQRRGIGTEATRALIQWAFEIRRSNRLRPKHSPNLRRQSK